MSNQAPSRASFWAAMTVVYVIWGSTYLAIRFTVEGIPPLLSAGSRFVFAGALLYVWARLRGASAPTPRQWGAAFVIGGFMLLGGNGGVVWAEQWIDSSLAAIMIATVPLWMALLEPIVFGGAKPGLRPTVGLVLGFAGVAYLVWEPGQSGAIYAPGLFALLAAAFLWANGSLLSSRMPVPRDPLLGASLFMMAGGATQLVAGFGIGELGDLALGDVTWKSWWALTYLIVFGSIIAYSAYVWLLRVGPASTVATYAYVNPVVAVFLGWWLADEVLSWDTLYASAAILAGVALITVAKRPRAHVQVRLPTGPKADDAASPTPASSGVDR